MPARPQVRMLSATRGLGGSYTYIHIIINIKQSYTYVYIYNSHLAVTYISP